MQRYNLRRLSLNFSGLASDPLNGDTSDFTLEGLRGGDLRRDGGLTTPLGRRVSKEVTKVTVVSNNSWLIYDSGLRPLPRPPTYQHQKKESLLLTDLIFNFYFTRHCPLHSHRQEKTIPALSGFLTTLRHKQLLFNESRLPKSSCMSYQLPYLKDCSNF